VHNPAILKHLLAAVGVYGGNKTLTSVIYFRSGTIIMISLLLQHSLLLAWLFLAWFALFWLGLPWLPALAGLPCLACLGVACLGLACMGWLALALLGLARLSVAWLALAGGNGPSRKRPQEQIIALGTWVDPQHS
jgi:hypothetical protein